MASFIYIYSKFTEEFLLLTAAGSFALLSVYCYHWVVKTRRLGAARNQVPAGMVKIYLNQLINEAQFVRTQLFGLIGGVPPDAGNFSAHFRAAEGHAPTSDGETNASSATAPIPSDLWDRFKALELQLVEKESMVININVEKTKLLEELENVKQDQKVTTAPAASGNQDGLVQKIKALEERLEEYALFEDDLANLKRLQQENAQLKKRVEEAVTYEQKTKSAPITVASTIPAPAATVDPAVLPSVFDSPSELAGLLDAAAVEALLEGTSATPPTPVPETKAAQGLEINPSESFAPPTPIQAAKPVAPSDEFEHLVDSVEGSLAKEKAVEAPVIAPPAPAVAAPVAQAAPASDIPSSEKSDEELLKEFENLLNS